MIGCPGCGAYLRFDIKSQMLKCDFCDSSYSVAQAESFRSASEVVVEEQENPDSTAAEYLSDEARQQAENGYKLYAFSCPQCGGTIYGDRQDLTGFCSYCGSPVELAGRLTTVEKPECVIPFQKTKEDCKTIFSQFVKKAFFLPKEYKDAEHIDSFRGIYMPYYVYKVHQTGAFRVDGTGKVYRRGDYIYTEIYESSGEMDSTYEGFEHDSSSTFSDDISESLGPFWNQDRVPFKGGYLAGFYADAADQTPAQFERNARDSAQYETMNQIALETHRKNSSVSVSTKNKMSNGTTTVEAEKTMYPVWFMSYKNGDRVAYAAVNGQTGKITADLPLDFRKFLLVAAILTVPLYFLLEMIFTLMPTTMLPIFSIMAAVAMGMFWRQSHNVMERDNADWVSSKERKKKVGTGTFVVGAIIAIGVYVGISGVGLVYPLGFAISAISACVALVFMGLSAKCYESLAVVGTKLVGFTAATGTAVAAVVGAAIMLISPVHDYWYYGGCLAVLVCILWNFLVIARNHNMLATRKPTQFNKKGGDDRA